MQEKTSLDGAADTPESAEPHHAEFVPHTLEGERRIAPVYDPASNAPGEEDPESSDTLDEALASVLPDDTEEADRDVPVFDRGEGDAFHLLDRSPDTADDTAVGDIGDEELLASEAADDEALMSTRRR